MNPRWKLRVDNIESEERSLKHSLSYFANWRKAVNSSEFLPHGEVLQARDRDRSCIAATTYKNLRFAVCGFVTYAKKMIHSKEVEEVRSGHSNTSALESRFSMVRRSGNDSTETYPSVVSNLNVSMTIKHSMKMDRKLVKGNKAYPPESIAPEFPEPLEAAKRNGRMMRCRKQETAVIQSTASILISPDQHALPLNLRKPVVSTLGILLKRKLQSKVLPYKSIIEFLRSEKVVKDLVVLALSSSVEHQTWIDGVFGASTQVFSDELLYLLEIAFQLLDASAKANKTSHESSFWWQVFHMMREKTIHLESPHPSSCSNHIRSYLFLFLAQHLLQWSHNLLDRDKEDEDQLYLTGNWRKAGKVSSINMAVVGQDLNKFFGWALHSVLEKYKKCEKLGEGGDPDQFELLTHMIGADEDIALNQDYLDQFYGHYYYFVNRGGYALVSPLYARLFHAILFAICDCLNKTTLFDTDDEKPMVRARATILGQIPGWVEEVEGIAATELQLLDSTKTCTELLLVIVTKVFNARTNTVLKRYQSTHLGRGGKKAVKSSLRDDMKHMGKGKKKAKRT